VGGWEFSPSSIDFDGTDAADDVFRAETLCRQGNIVFVRAPQIGKGSST